MKKVCPKIKMYAAQCDMTLTDLCKRVNALQGKAGYDARPLTRRGMYRYKQNPMPQDRVYAISAILGKHPKDIFVDVYDDEKLQFYKNLLKSS